MPEIRMYENKPPNFVVIVTDDQGYGDLSCLGNGNVATPHLDALVADGVRLTDWYSNGAVCSPTRASVLTGRYPQRTGITGVLPGYRSARGLSTRVSTLPARLRDAGYRTYMVGKWHLGAAESDRPGRHGFDRWFGHLGGCVDYYSHILYWGMNRPGPGINPLHDLWEDGREVWRNGEYMTSLIAEHALDYLRDASAHDQPFFLYLAYNAPHYPLHAPREVMDRFADLGPDRQAYAAVLSAMDDSVGRIRRELERRGLADNTCIVFTSDNGPSRESRNWLDGRTDSFYGGSVNGFRGYKGSLFEGGIRVPGAVTWPERIPPGTVCTTPSITMDIYPTLLRAADPGAGLDGVDGADLMPMLTGQSAVPERDLYWAHRDQLAIRRGRFKLVLNGEDGEHASPPPRTLSDLSADPGERDDISDSLPEVARSLEDAVHRWKSLVDERPL